MTESLREALRRAASDGTGGLDTTGRDLLQRGRQRARRRTISGTAVGALALVAAIGVPLVPNLLAGPDDLAAPNRSAGPSHPPTDPASGFTHASDLEGLCVGIDRIADWKVRAAVHSDGTLTAVMTSPDGTMWADCVGSQNSATAMIPTRPNVEDDPGYTYIRNGFWVDDSCANTEQPCHWGVAGQIPTEIARMVFESSDGQTSEAHVDNGYFAWQSEVNEVDVLNGPLWVELYDADGNLIDRVNANRHPDNW